MQPDRDPIADVPHPGSDLVAFLSGELTGKAHDRVARHLAVCPTCRGERDDFRRALDGLRNSLPAPPPVHWARYRAELRRKIEARHEPRGWWRWPVPLALSAGLAGILLLLATHGGFRPAERADVMAFDEAAIAPRLELLRNYQLVERLDLLEDFDILRSLNGPAGRRES
jgi:anti-sigma factor RsiW